MNEFFRFSSITIMDVSVFAAALLLIGLYAYAVKKANQRFKRWPRRRTAFWTAGICFAAVSAAGPLAHFAHHDFTAHMTGHLLLGMAAPLCLVLAAPVTLLLKMLPVAAARQLSRILKSRYVRIVSDPVIASLLNIGFLWLFYTTDLYSVMQHNGLHGVLYIHIFLAGYFFTASIIYIDPVSHRKTFAYRSAVLIMAFAAHGILAKYLYANPPASVSAEEAQQGAMVMYYGGDLVDLLLIIIFCAQWFKAWRPRSTLKTLFLAK